MSLRLFHLVFIALSIVLAAFFGAWSLGQYRSVHDPVFAVTAGGAMLAALGLAAYAALFQRKTRKL